MSHQDRPPGHHDPAMDGLTEEHVEREISRRLGHRWRVVCDGCRFHTGGRVLVEDTNPRPMGWRPYRGKVHRHRPRRRVVHREMMENLERKARHG